MKAFPSVFLITSPLAGLLLQCNNIRKLWLLVWVCHDKMPPSAPICPLLEITGGAAGRSGTGAFFQVPCPSTFTCTGNTDHWLKKLLWLKRNSSKLSLRRDSLWQFLAADSTAVLMSLFFSLNRLRWSLQKWKWNEGNSYWKSCDFDDNAPQCHMISEKRKTGPAADEADVSQHIYFFQACFSFLLQPKGLSLLRGDNTGKSCISCHISLGWHT